MSDEARSMFSDKELLETKIQNICTKIEADSNPEELENLKKVIKKNVPFTRRGYFMAYLLREALTQQQRGPRSNEARPQRKPREQREPREMRSTQPQQSGQERAERPERPAKPVREIPADAKTLYLNIGKMKKIYAKELAQMIQEKIGVTRDDIYQIKIHDKYTFVSMNQENCAKAIEVLNGMELKGRTLTVNYSNKD